MIIAELHIENRAGFQPLILHLDINTQGFALGWYSTRLRRYSTGTFICHGENQNQALH